MNKLFNRSELTNDKQNLSSRINAVHCGILKTLKRYRNSFHSCGMTHFVKCVAFTLAETLVVMGIIGVVAALTIPNLNQSTGDREKVAKLKKVYSNLEDAFGRATAVYGPIDEWFTGFSDDDDLATNKRVMERLTEFMKISKNCGTDGEGCFSTESYKTLDNKTITTPADWEDEYMVLLADGTALDFYKPGTDCGDSSDDYCGHIYVDIDGPKGANTIGKDYFWFLITKNGITPEGDISDVIGLSTCFASGQSCAGWVIRNGNMDYLKATKGKCPNGTTLSWENTSCK